MSNPTTNCVPCQAGCVTIQVGPPGPQGPPGTPGTNGTNGINAFSVTQASFTVPNVGDNVTISVDDGLWAALGMTVYIQNAGYYLVENNSSTTLTVQNIGTDGNASPGTIIATEQTISPSASNSALSPNVTFNLTINQLVGGTSTCLDSISTTELIVPYLVSFILTGTGLVSYELQTGTDATVSPGIIRPVDYSVSNTKVWYQVL